MNLDFFFFTAFPPQVKPFFFLKKPTKSVLFIYYQKNLIYYFETLNIIYACELT